MKMETKIEYFGIAAVLLFGAVLGGAATYSMMDSRLDSLQAQVKELESERKVVYVNQTRQERLIELFENVDQSVVSVTAYGEQDSQGSGFVYSKKGYIITNEHVVDGANRIEVTFTDGVTLNAELVGKDKYTDIAVLKVDRKGLKPLELANSSKVQVGQTAIAVGNPFGLRGSMTAGIISQKGRMLSVAGGFSIPNVLQTDAAINPGNSGGPLLNIQGEVIGVNTAIQTQTGTFTGVGFAIPSNTVRRAAEAIIAAGDYDHPWLGVSGRTMSADLAQAIGVNQTSGFLVIEVVEGSPADRAGIQGGNRTATVNGYQMTVGGDIIVAINGRQMEGITEILNFLNTEVSVGETVNVTVVRDGERITLPLTLEERPND
ncbi:MAG: S1C family serine protease [Candidatus Nanohaloarchaea archaeon]